MSELQILVLLAIWIVAAVLLFVAEYFWEKYKAEKIPRLYTCHNNGVTIVVRQEDYEDVVKWYEREVEMGQRERVNGILHVVTPAAVFSSRPELRGKVTATEEAMNKLLYGCIVEGRRMYVPFTSNPVSFGVPADADERFSRMLLGTAYYMVYGWGKTAPRKWEETYGYGIPIDAIHQRDEFLE